MNSKKMHFFIKSVFLLFLWPCLTHAAIEVNLNFGRNVKISELLPEGVLIAPNWILGSLLQPAPTSVEIEGQKLRVISVYNDSPSRQFTLIQLEKPYTSSTLTPISRARFQELKLLRGNDFLFPVLGASGETLVGESRINNLNLPPQSPVPINYAASRAFLSDQSGGVFLRTPKEPKMIGLALPSYSENDNAVLYTLTLKDQQWIDRLIMLDALGGDTPSSIPKNQLNSSLKQGEEYTLVGLADKSPKGARVKWLTPGVRNKATNAVIAFALSDNALEAKTKTKGTQRTKASLDFPDFIFKPINREEVVANLIDPNVALNFTLKHHALKGGARISGCPLEVTPLASPELGTRLLTRARISLNQLPAQHLFIRNEGRWKPIRKPKVFGSSSLLSERLPLGTPIFVKQGEEYHLVGLAERMARSTRIWWLTPEVQNQIDNATIAFALSGTSLVARNKSQKAERLSWLTPEGRNQISNAILRGQEKGTSIWSVGPEVRNEVSNYIIAFALSAPALTPSRTLQNTVQSTEDSPVSADFVFNASGNEGMDTKLLAPNVSVGIALDDRILKDSVRISGCPFEVTPLDSLALETKPLTRARTSLDQLSTQNLFIRNGGRWNLLGKINISGISSLIPQSLPLGTPVFVKRSEEYHLVGLSGRAQKGSRIWWLTPKVQSGMDNAIIKFALSDPAPVPSRTPQTTAQRTGNSPAPAPSRTPQIRSTDTGSSPAPAPSRAPQATVQSTQGSSASGDFVFNASDREEVEWNIMIWCNDLDANGGRIFEVMRLLAEAANSPKVRILTQYKTAALNTVLRTLPDQVIDDFRGVRRFVIRGKKHWKDTISENLASQGSGVSIETMSDAALTPLKTPVLRERVRYQDLSYLVRYNLETKEAISMGARESLIKFLNWCKEFPSKKQALIIWAHGGGWLWISNDEDKYLSAVDLQEALSAVFGTTKLDLLRFDSCRTQMLEMAYELRDRVKYIMGSQQTTSIDLAPLSYGVAINHLSDRPEIEPKDLTLQMLDDYRESMVSYIGQLAFLYTGQSHEANIRQGKFKDFIDSIPDDPMATWSLEGDGYTISALDTLKVGPVYQKLQELTGLLMSHYNVRGPSLSARSLTNVRRGVLKFGGDRQDTGDAETSVDLFDLADKLEQIPAIDPSLKTACQQMKALLGAGSDQFILRFIAGGESVEKSHGISIYFPPGSSVTGGKVGENLNDIYSALQMNQVEPSWYSWIRQAR